MLKKIINRRLYSTETAQELHAFSCGLPGDECGFEEHLYQAESGQGYFLYGKGGSASKYPEEDIVPLKNSQARQWIKANLR